MVEIRKLKPSIDIRMPMSTTVNKKDSFPGRIRQERWRKDFPSPTPLETPCVLWQGPLDNHGYGRLAVNRKPKRIHRYIFELYRGRPLGPTQVVIHRCDQPLCFRFDHLRVGTVAENNADMKAKGRAKPPPRYRDVHPMSKLGIRNDYRDGLDVPTLAVKYGLHRKTIRRIVADVEFGTGPGRRPGAKTARRGVV